MVDYVESEEEQIAKVKKWWDENGKAIAVGVIIALAGTFGLKAWDAHKIETGEAASELYQNMLNQLSSVEQNEESDLLASGLASQLKTEFTGTIYSYYAAWFMAKEAIGKGDLAAAESELRWAAENGASGSIEMITRQRLAKVLIAQDKLDDALAQVENIDAGGHQGMIEEVKGDIYLAKGDATKARAAYKKAFDIASEAGSRRPLLQMKLNDLAVAAEDA